MSSQTTATATLTGRTGANQLMSALALGSISQLNLNFAATRGTIIISNPTNGQPRTIEFDMSVTTTLTDTITSLVHALTISGS